MLTNFRHTAGSKHDVGLASRGMGFVNMREFKKHTIDAEKGLRDT